MAIVFENQLKQAGEIKTEYKLKCGDCKYFKIKTQMVNRFGQSLLNNVPQCFYNPERIEVDECDPACHHYYDYMNK